MTISPIEPITKAAEYVKKVLFQPFDISKWFVLGFCAWLANLGQGGGANYNFNLPGRGFSGKDLGGATKHAVEYLQENMLFVISMAVIGIVFSVALHALFCWLSSRGRFMLLDGVVHDRAAVKKPWEEFASLANSLFVFLFALGVIFALVGLIVFVVFALSVWPSLSQGEFSGGVLIALILTGLILIPISLIYAYIKAITTDFVVPVMYKRNLDIKRGWSVTWNEFIKPNLGSVVLFYLMKIALGIGVAIIAFLVTCVTCCIAALPYLGTVVLLPIFVFWRSYSLMFMEQAGPEFQLFHQKWNQKCVRVFKCVVVTKKLPMFLKI